MNYIVLISLLCLVSVNSSFLATKNEDPSCKKIQDFLIGVMISLKVGEKVPDAMQCISNVQSSKTEVEKAIALIETEQFHKMVQGMEIIYDVVANVASACGQTMKEGKSYSEELINGIRNQTLRQQGILRIEENFVEVVKHFNDFQKNWRNQRYTLAGISLGWIGRIYYWGPQSNISQIQNPKETEDLQITPAEWKYCLQKQQFDIKAINYAKTPSKGIKNTIMIKGNILAAEKMKEVNIITKFDDVQLDKRSDKRQDILTPGQEWTYEYTVDIPSIAPSGNYEVSFDFQNDQGVQWGCVDLKFKL